MSGLPDASSTRVCVLTAAGRGSVAVVAVAGPAAVAAVDCHFRAANGRLLADQPIERILFGHWGDAAGEELIVCRRGVDEVEIHCHGGSQASTRVVEQLTAAGCMPVDWRQWLAGRSLCALTAESHVALARAATLRVASILLDQYHGALRQAVDAAHADLHDGELERACRRIGRLLEYASVGLHLTEPWNVVIAGRPNVGKSSLMNALMGYARALVFDQPGTTRDVLSAMTSFDGWPVRLSDTAGLHRATDALETAGIALARRQLEQADLVVWVLDASRIDENTMLSIHQRVCQQSREAAVVLDLPHVLAVVNKIDLAPVFSALDERTVATCATSGAGIEDLIAVVAGRLVPQPPPPGAAVPFAQRQVALLGRALEQCQQKNAAAAVATLQHLLQGIR